jgi:hypothetical protein
MTPPEMMKVRFGAQRSANRLNRTARPVQRLRTRELRTGPISAAPPKCHDNVFSLVFSLRRLPWIISRFSLITSRGLNGATIPLCSYPLKVPVKYGAPRSTAWPVMRPTSYSRRGGPLVLGRPLPTGAPSSMGRLGVFHFLLRSMLALRPMNPCHSLGFHRTTHPSPQAHSQQVFTG